MSYRGLSCRLRHITLFMRAGTSVPCTSTLRACRDNMMFAEPVGGNFGIILEKEQMKTSSGSEKAIAEKAVNLGTT